MAQNPQAPHGPQGGNDPAGSTQMFRAFVDEGGTSRSAARAAASSSSGPRVGLILGVLVGVVVLVGVAWLALG
ncbi:hypothetical protein ACSMX9_14820 [Streptomyces sp. LE64]|uniref:hypothetical protein n=1 Tax=unclassified Streptomyces TaxID=2593676 RepID=UPI0033301EE0